MELNKVLMNFSKDVSLASKLIGLLLFIGTIITASTSVLASNNKNTRELVIVADEDFPPYTYMDKGELKGIYVELLAELSNQLLPDYQVKIIAQPWKRALQTVKSGRAFAIIPPHRHYTSRPYIAPYSVPLLTETIVAFCRENINLDLALSGNPMNKVNVGINAGYEILTPKYQKAISRRNIIIRENKSTNANLLKLLNGRIDCYINDRRTILHGLKEVQATLAMSQTLVSVIEVDVLSENTAHIGFSREFFLKEKEVLVNEIDRIIEKEKKDGSLQGTVY